jgi:hypothetical protein
MSCTSVTLFGPNLASSSLTCFEGSVRSLTLNGTNDLFDAAEPAGLSKYGGRYEPAETRESGTSASAEYALRDGRPFLRFTGAASAGVELDANERAQGDGVELKFDFLLERGTTGTLCTVGDANQPARITVRGAEIVLCANGLTRRCGPVASGVWQRLRLRSQGDLTRVTLDHNPAAEVQHAPQATWLYLGEGYRPAEPASNAPFSVAVQSVRSRVILKTHTGP